MLIGYRPYQVHKELRKAKEQDLAFPLPASRLPEDIPQSFLRKSEK
jgi:hypothetical protein